jgi:hypothetical protein
MKFLTNLLNYRKSNQKSVASFQEILELIEKRKQEFAKLPFFEFLADESIDPMKRLAWAPYMAFFAMSFKDINAYALYKESPDDPIQKMINQHCEEDGRHWRWYLKDIKKLGLDQPQKFTDHLEFLWGKDTEKTRYLCHNLFALLTFEEDTVIKLAAIEAIEATGVVALPLFAKLGNELQKVTKDRYSYFSASHAKVETGHIISGLDCNETEKFLTRIKLTEEQKSKAFRAVEIVFNSYTEFINGIISYVKTVEEEQTNNIEYYIPKNEITSTSTTLEELVLV